AWATSASSSAASCPIPTCRSCTRWAWRRSSGRARRWTRSSPTSATTRGPTMQAALVERFRAGDRLALSRLLTLRARGESVEETLSAIGSPKQRARVVAITGAGGVGKSSLTGKLIEAIRASGQTVAVLACDPQSPLSGGALLGDRFRMPPRPDDD